MLWNGNECEKTKVKGISRQPSPLQVMTDQKQLENVEYFSSLGSIINGARCTWEIKSRIPWQKHHSKRRHQQIGLKFKGEAINVLNLEHRLVWCCKLYTSGSRSEGTCKVLKCAGEELSDQLDGSCEK
jgi:hypothetical protein